MMSKWLSNLPVRWKVLFAPAFLIVVLMVIGAYALYVQRDAKSTVYRLMTGPVTQVELIADLENAMWTAQTNLYRLTATAANETDTKKISDFSKKVAKLMADIPAKLQAFESIKGLDKKTLAKTAHAEDRHHRLYQAGQERRRYGRYRRRHRLGVHDGRPASLRQGGEPGR